MLGEVPGGWCRILAAGQPRPPAVWVWGGHCQETCGPHSLRVIKGHLNKQVTNKQGQSNTFM